MPISIPTSVAGISIPGAVNGPLNLLYGNKYDKTNYRFPRDVGSNPTRQHVILFTIKTPEPGNLGAILTDMAKAGTNIAKKGLNAITTAGTQVGSGDYEGAKNTVITKGQAIGGSTDVETLATGTNTLTNVKLNRKIGDSIALYVPDTVNVSYSAQYDDSFSLTDALGKPYFLAQGAVSLFNTFKNAGSESAINTINKAGNDPFVRTAVASIIDKVAGTNLKDVALNQGGYAMNPQLQVLFRGIGFRQFQFDFVLTPYSQEEADTIKSIIEKFKMASAPEITTNGVFNQGLFMKIPDVFDIQFLYKGAENTNVHKIGESVLTNVNVDYAGAGTWATHNDGSPVQIKLTLQFTETVIIDKNKIKEGY
jgi:hypothetical protein